MDENKPVFALVVLLLFLMESVFAFTGEQLVDKCNASFNNDPNKQSVANVLEKALDSGSCVGFVGGVIHGVNLVGSMLEKQGATKKNFICLPEGVHAKGLVKTTLAHFKKNPKELKLPAQLGIYNTFAKKYPCEIKK